MEIGAEIRMIKKQAMQLVSYCENLEKKLSPPVQKKASGLSEEQKAKLKMNVRSTVTQQ